MWKVDPFDSWAIVTLDEAKIIGKIDIPLLNSFHFKTYFCGIFFCLISPKCQRHDTIFTHYESRVTFPRFTDMFEVDISHVVDGENEYSGIFVHTLSDLVNNTLKLIKQIFREINYKIRKILFSRNFQTFVTK